MAHSSACRSAPTRAAWACASTSQHLVDLRLHRVGGSLEDRVCEYVDHLHEHFVDPVRIANGRYVAPARARLQHHHEAGLAGRVRVPGRRRLAGAAVTGGVAGGRTRWVSCALLFFVTTINYVDRQIIAILKPTLWPSSAGQTSGPTPRPSSCSKLAYVIGLPAGRIMEKLGNRLGLAPRSCSGAWRRSRTPGRLVPRPRVAHPAPPREDRPTVVLLTSAAAGFALVRFSSAPPRRATPGLHQTVAE